jgi:hypothetical protein
VSVIEDLLYFFCRLRGGAAAYARSTHIRSAFTDRGRSPAAPAFPWCTSAAAHERSLATLVAILEI